MRRVVPDPVCRLSGSLPRLEGNLVVCKRSFAICMPEQMGRVMRQGIKRTFLLVLALLAAPAFGGDVTWSPERPGTSNDDPIDRPRDLSGRSIKCPRVRAVPLPCRR